MSIKQSRRRYLRSIGTAGIFATAGCIGSSRSGSTPVKWPPAKPETLPDRADVPDLSAPTIGDSSAIPAQVFEDFGTMMAGKLFHEEVPGLQYDIDQGRLKLIYRDYPLPSLDWSYPVAIAARSVQHHAGEPAFWDFATRVTRDYRPSIYYTKERVLDAAEAAGAPPDVVQRDVESWRFYPVVERDRQRGNSYEIDIVPSTALGRDRERLMMNGAGAGRMIWFLEHRIEDPDSDPNE